MSGPLRSWSGRIALLGVLAGAAMAPRAATAQETHLLVVTGLGGDQEYTDRFHEWARTLVTAATSRYELPADNVTYLGEKPDLDPDLIADRSTRENIGAALDAIAGRVEAGDHVVVVIFGHGSFTDSARVNLPRRDLSASDFAELLERFEDQHVTFVNAASASGPFIEALSGPNRTVVTATKTGRERNAPMFGGYFVEAFATGEEDADQNRDERVSMLEAFVYARARVAQTYETDGLLATEHAMLDDNGDGEGSDEPDPVTGEGADGTVARTMFLTSGSALRAEMAFPDDPELQALYQERRDLEARVEELRRIRGGADPEQYRAELETLMVDLALKSREIRELEAARSAEQDQR